MSVEDIYRALEKVSGVPRDMWGGGPVMTGPEWKERGELYGHKAELVVCHDGGVLAPYFNWDYDCPKMMEKMNVELEKVGYWAEQCTSWYTAIYKA